jgi:hypothetical protein
MIKDIEAAIVVEWRETEHGDLSLYFGETQLKTGDRIAFGGVTLEYRLVNSDCGATLRVLGSYGLALGREIQIWPHIDRTPGRRKRQMASYLVKASGEILPFHAPDGSILHQSDTTELRAA